MANRRLKFDAPTHHMLVVDGQEVTGGRMFTVSDERAEELIADPNVPIAGALRDLTRPQLDDLAEQAGLVPSDFRTKQDVIDALENQPVADGEGHQTTEKEN